MTQFPLYNCFTNVVSARGGLEIAIPWQTPPTTDYPVINNGGSFYKEGQIQQKNKRCPDKTVLMKGVGGFPYFQGKGSENQKGGVLLSTTCVTGAKIALWGTVSWGRLMNPIAPISRRSGKKGPT